MREVDYINKDLKNRFGQLPDGRPLFRVVWSEDQFEIRRGTFSKFNSEGIFLSDEEDVTKRVKKYPYIGERWVLERIFFPKGLEDLNPELPELDKGSYEPIFVFQTKKDAKYLPVNKRAVDFIMWNLLEYEPGKSKELMDESMRKEKADNIAFFENYLSEKGLSGAELGETVSGFHQKEL